MKKQTIFLCAALLLALLMSAPAAAFSDIRDDEVRVAAETLAALGADAQAESLCDARNTLISNVRAVRSSYNIPNSRARNKLFC